MLMRATLDTLGEARTVWVADSFQGFPADERRGVGSRAYDFLAAPLDEVRESFARLGLDARRALRPRLLRGDAAAARRRPLGARAAGRRHLRADPRWRCARLYPGLAPGGYLVLDDYGSFPGCRRAVDEFRAEHGITEPIEQVDATCVRWRRESDRADRRRAARTRRAPRAAVRGRPTPTSDGARARAARGRARAASWPHAEAEVGLRPWLRRRLTRGAMIVFASSITDPELYPRCAEPGIRLAAEPDSRCSPTPPPGSIFRSYNLILDSVAERDDLEALVLLHQDAELASPDFCAKLRAGAARPRRRRRRAASARSACAASPGGRARSPGRRSPTATASSAAASCRRSPGRRRAARLRADRRGRHRRRLRARALAVGGAQRPLRRVARPAARLRLRLLPPGARGRPQGRDRGLHASSTTTRSSWSATPRPGSRRTCAWPRSGTAGCRASATAAATGSSARGAPRPRRRSRAPRRSPRCCRRTPRATQLERELAEVTESTSWRLTRRCAGSTPRAGRAGAR